jgi:hypothetical protein
MTAQPLTVTTELEAVNIMLQAVGADPVSSLEVSADSDVTNARSILAETSKQIQSQGWDFNTDERYPMARTVDNEYVVPPNVAEIDVSEDFPEVRSTQRAGKLWDQINHTFVWTRDLTFNVTWLFPFEELPQTARHYITMKAARKFQARMLGSESLGKFTAQDEAESYHIFVDAEAIDAQHNILTGNYSVYRTLNRWPSSQAR